MNTYKLSNIALDDFRRFLFEEGCSRTETYSRTKGRGGHEKWNRADLTRPIILQTHISPVPEHIVKNTLRNLGIKRKDFFAKMYQKN